MKALSEQNIHPQGETGKDECEAKEKKTFNDDSLCGTLRRYERSINDLKRSVNNTQRESFISLIA